MQGHPRSRLLRYGVAVLAVAVALNLKLLLVPWVERESPFTFFLAAVMVSAWFGGLKPGLLATALSVPVIDFFFLEPLYTLDFGMASGNSLSLLLFLGEGSAISLLVGSLYAARKAEQAHARELAASEERYRRIVETAFEGIWSRDAEGRTNYVNPRMAEMLGYSAAAMLGRPWEDFVDLQDRPRIRHHWEQRRQGTTDQYEFRFRRRDGADLWAIVTSNPIFRDLNTFDGALAMLTDVSERKQAEEALRRAKEDLEVKVAERTADLERTNAQLQLELAERHRAEEALHQAKEAAEAANQAKSIFLANVSHEIRNPMNVLLVAVDLLRQTDVTPKQAEYLQIVRASTQSLLAVINDLLDLSKIEAGKLDLDQLPFHLEDCLGKALKALAPRAHMKGLELACALDPAVPEVLVGDPNRLGQLLTNLIGNAVKFTERGEVVVRIRRFEEDKETGRQGDKVTRRQGDKETDENPVALSPCHLVTLSFEVSDTGRGVPPEKIAAIFRPFEQADTSITRQYGGTGLGLAIAARLVALMGGDIGVDSVVDQGSTFHFTARFGTIPRPAADRVGDAGPRDVRVLVGEDNASHRAILVETLRSWHWQPITVEGAQAALEVLTQARAAGEPSPLVLLDAHLPTMDGWALAEQLQHQPGLAGATLLMLTSTDGPGEIARCRELGITAWLTKPFVPSELRAALLQILGQRPRKAGDHTAASAAAVGRSLRVLITEDNIINQSLMVDLVEKLGHTAVTASSGPQALAALERESFDVVLMDVQMPQMSGFEVTARIRAREQVTGGHVPIIAVTALAMKGDRERCLEAGMDDYLPKPLQAQDLQTMLARLQAHG